MNIADWVTPEELHALLWHDGGSALFWRERTPDMFAHRSKPERACAAWNERYANKLAGTLGAGMRYSVTIHDRAFSAATVKAHMDQYQQKDLNHAEQ